jgi:hypothetical protein
MQRWQLSDEAFIEQLRRARQRRRRWRWASLTGAVAFAGLTATGLYLLNGFAAFPGGSEASKNALNIGTALGFSTGIFGVLCLYLVWQFVSDTVGDRRENLLIAYHDQLKEAGIDTGEGDQARSDDTGW